MSDLNLNQNSYQPGQYNPDLSQQTPLKGAEGPVKTQATTATEKSRYTDTHAKADPLKTAENKEDVHASKPVLPEPKPGSDDPALFKEAGDKVDTFNIKSGLYTEFADPKQAAEGATAKDLEAAIKQMNESLGEFQAKLMADLKANETPEKPQPQVKLSEDPAIITYARQSGITPEKAAEAVQNALNTFDGAKLGEILKANSKGEVDFNTTVESFVNSDTFKNMRIDAMMGMVNKVNFTPPLNTESRDKMQGILKNYLQQYVDNPHFPVPPFFESLSPAIRDLLPTVNNAILSGVINKMDGLINLSPNPLENVDITQVTANKMNDTIDVAADMAKKGIKLLQSLPDFPEKDQMINYLKQISLAIAKVRDILAEMVNAKDDAAKRANASKIHETMMAIKTQQAEQANIEKENVEKTKKQKVRDGFKKFGEILGKTLLCVAVAALAVAAFATGNPILGAVAICMLVMAITMCTPAADKINKGMQKVYIFMNEAMVKAFGKEFGGSLAFVNNFLLLTVASGFNPMLIANGFAAPGGPLDTMLMTYGNYGTPVDEEKRQKILMGCGIAAQVVAAIVMTVLTAGIGSAAVATANTADRAQKIATGVSNAAKVIGMTATVMQSTTSIAQSAIEIELAKIDKRIIRSKATIEQIDEIINALKKLLEKLVEALMTGLQDVPDMTLQLNTMEQNMYTKRSQAVMEMPS